MATEQALTLNRFAEQFGYASGRAATKVKSYMTDYVQEFISNSPFTVMASSDGEGNCDASPKGGKPGFVKGDGQVTLEDLGARTLLKYSGEMQVGGVIARVGQRLIGTISKKLTRQFFQDLGREAESAE